MSLEDRINMLTEEALHLKPGNLRACGRMLSLLDDIDESSLAAEVALARHGLEQLILRELEDNDANPDVIIQAVQRMQAIFRGDAVPDTAPPALSHIATSAATINTQADESIVDDPELLRDFILESRDHLESIEISMVEWEKDPGDTEIINAIFRPFHTIKGVSGFLNLTVVNRLAHHLENLLDEARAGRIPHSPELSDIIFDGVDLLKTLINAVETGGAPPTDQDEPFIARIVDFLEGSGAGGNDGAEPANVKRIGEILLEDGKVRKEDLADALALQQSAGRPLGEILIIEKKVAAQDIRDAMRKQAEAAPEDNVKRIGEILLEDGKVLEEDIADALTLQQSAGRPLGEILISEKKVAARDVRDAVRKQAEAAPAAVETHIRVDTAKMDQLLNTVGELVIAQSMVEHNPVVMSITDQQFIRDISHLTRVTTMLQNISMSIRLVPIGMTFQKMNRIVRDLARKSGKKINLVLEGQSAEIDRNIVEELYNPLVHMIRNSCDHGIQTPARRAARGRPVEGTIVLKAEHSGGNIVISVEDDGEGLNREAILRKARERGIVGRDDDPDPAEIDRLILTPGFSTAEIVTDVSGRGVGLDVVRKTVEKLRGTIGIESVPGKGTTFTLNLPLATAIVDAILVLVGEDRFILPTLSVSQIVHPGSSDINTVAGRGRTVTVRGRLIPIVPIREILHVRGEQAGEGERVMVIVEDEGRQFALEVDGVLGKEEVVVKIIGEQFKGFRGVAGSAILGDGHIVLILDVHSLVCDQDDAADSEGS